LYRRTFCIYGRFVERMFCREGRYVEGCYVYGRFVEGRFVEERFVVVPFIQTFVVSSLSMSSMSTLSPGYYCHLYWHPNFNDCYYYLY
jgi:hypothetical protein